jgi:hypothetical protein
MEAKLALTEVALQSDDKLAAKNLSEHSKSTQDDYSFCASYNDDV